MLLMSLFAMLFGVGFSGDKSEVSQGGLPGVESPEVDHEHARTGDDGFLAHSGTDFDPLAEDVGEFFESPPVGVPHVQPPDGFDKLFANAFVASSIDAAKALVGPRAVLAGA